MKSRLLVFYSLILLIGNQSLFGQTHNLSTAPVSGFIENKGQIQGAGHGAREDIHYALHGPGVTVFIGMGALHYQFSEKLPAAKIAAQPSDDFLKKELPDLQSPRFATARMDVTLENANTDAEVVTEEQQQYYETYYLPGCPAGTQARCYRKITYKNIYPGIDWVIFARGNGLEHEFIVTPGADASRIKLKYSGQTSLKIDAQGCIVATTALGTIKENAPVCFRLENNGSIKAAYRLNGDELSYHLSAGKSTGVLIDPSVEWGTYYGPDSSTTTVYGVACDDSGHAFISGLTWSAIDIATSGSFLDTIYPGTTDGFVVKFDSLGNRIWATYYGGTANDWSRGIACDDSGNVYICGTTNSRVGIATPGTQQTTYSGGWDNFVAKLDKNGMRQWGTYLGGPSDEFVAAITCDHAGHVYASGVTNNTVNIASAGSFKPVKGGGHDAYMVQYDDATGLRTWGTYYGGDADDYAGGMCTDNTNNVYLCGYTSSNTGVAPASAWQPVFAGSTDVFLVKFDVSGARLWATYYGGPASESAGAVTWSSGIVSLLGTTSSDTAIASPGCHQPSRAGAGDAFLAQFESSTGFRFWGTYFGGPADEDVSNVNSITTDDSGNVYITGPTKSTSGIASPGALQSTFGGGATDGFFAKFTGSGVLVWSTYYGGSGDDEGRGCAYDGKCVYLAGQTNSTNNIATPGSFLSYGGGGSSYYQGFLVKFNIIEPCMLGAISGAPSVCLGDTVLLGNATAGGAWTSSQPAVATVSPSGRVTGVSAGTAIITYAWSASCYVTLEDSVMICPSAVHQVSDNGGIVEVVPNPATSFVEINQRQYTYNRYELYNELGQKMLQGPLTNNINSIDVRGLSNGLYYIKLYCNTSSINLKFIKQ